MTEWTLGRHMVHRGHTDKEGQVCLGRCSRVLCLPAPCPPPALRREVGKLACVQPPGVRSGIPRVLFLGPSTHSLFGDQHPPQKGGAPYRRGPMTPGTERVLNARLSTRCPLAGWVRGTVPEGAGLPTRLVPGLRLRPNLMTQLRGRV